MSNVYDTFIELATAAVNSALTLPPSEVKAVVEKVISECDTYSSRGKACPHADRQCEECYEEFALAKFSENLNDLDICRMFDDAIDAAKEIIEGGNKPTTATGFDQLVADYAADEIAKNA